MERRFSFSGTRLRRLSPPAEGRVYYHDEDMRGLGLEMTAAGGRSFRVYRKFKGRPKKITLGWFDADMPETRELPDGAEPLDLLGNSPALNVRMARKLARAVCAELDAGRDPSSSQNGDTLGAAFRRYRDAGYKNRLGKAPTQGESAIKMLVRKANRRRALAFHKAATWHWERYLGALPNEPRKKHGKDRRKAPGGVNWERRKLAEITYADVARLREDLLAKVGPTTANHVLELLRAIYNYAGKKLGYEGKNPAAKQDKCNTTSRERFLEPDEAKRFFDALANDPDQDFADYVRLSLYTGARRGNVLGMRWEDVNLEGARWRVSGELMKNGEPLTIPLVQEAVEVLQARAAKANGRAWVFPGRTPVGHAGPMRLQWRRLLTTAKLPDLHIHDLRRSLGSWMASSGASTTVTMRALGHKSVTAAMVYQRLAADPVRAAMQTAVAAMLKAGEGEGKVVEMKKGGRTRAAKGGR